MLNGIGQYRVQARGSNRSYGIRSLASSILYLTLATVSLGQCTYDVCGYWYSENYNAGVPVEYMSVDLVGDRLICTKVLGDPYVPTGQVTWEGVPTSCEFSGSLYVTSGLGAPIFGIQCTITILSEDHIKLVSPQIGTLQFYRSTTDHLTAEGVDYSNFPVSCITCLSEFPNVFTPNSDGINDLFEKTCGTDAHLFSVTDRWGITVYESQDPKPVWDGRNGWDPCPEGIYFWSLILAEDRTGKVRHGIVHLFR